MSAGRLPGLLQGTDEARCRSVLADAEKLRMVGGPGVP